MADISGKNQDFGCCIGGSWSGHRPLPTRSACDDASLGIVPCGDAATTAAAVASAQAAYVRWRLVPAPRRARAVAAIAAAVRQHRDALAALITEEIGKIPSEAQGEVQEVIDVAEHAVGLSRTIAGQTVPSERPAHRLMEQWHPLGVVGVITAFNFPMAVWAWNALIALVCGDTVVWKPSEKAFRCAIALQRLAVEALRADGSDPAVINLVCGGADAGQALAEHPQVPLVSATGSTRMGRAVAVAVAERLGRSLLELGGNNAAIVSPSADLALAVRAITFAAAGTAGQRCTTLRRLLVHDQIYAALVPQLTRIIPSLSVGDPRLGSVLVGPLIDGSAREAMQQALAAARAQGGIVHGGESLPGPGSYVRPAVVEIAADAPIVQDETFAPILYVSRYATLEGAIAANNAVAHGLSSALISRDLIEAEAFLGPAGSDCGLANLNMGTSGAEIGGAFGGDKATGGGRESGSDAWKAYMRRMTSAINGGHDLPLAQGVSFDAS
jgi:aldehyde dehydrogenase (NAD+)